MSNNSEQNGRQATPQSPATAPPTDPRRRNVSVPSAAPSDKPQICRDNIWGICTLGSQCKYRHQLDYESMRAVLKFCHEFQNRDGCNRLDCTYLHTSREEEKLFLTSGVIPRVLAERYAAMARMTGSTDGVPALYDYAQQQAAPAAGPAPTPALAPPSGPPAVLPPPVPMPLTPFLALPPPPPPPITSTATTRIAPNLYSTPPVTQQPAPHPQLPPLLPPEYDPSRPPPPAPSQSRLKRPPDTSCEAGPSCKLRITDSTSDVVCDTCVQRELRIQIYKQEMEKMQKEEEIQRLILNKKTEEYENSKLLLKSALSPPVYRILEDYIEGLTPNSSMLSQAKPAPFTSGTSTVPRQFLMQLIERVFGGGVNNFVDAIPSTSQQSQLLQTFMARTRSQTNSMSSVSGASSEMLDAVLNALRNNTSNDGAVAGTSGVPPVTNGVARATSGGAAAVSPPSVPVRPAGAPRFPTTMPRYGAPPVPPATSAAPPSYMPYTPAMPPPIPAALAPAPAPTPSSRPYYMPYVGASTPVPAATPAPSATPAPAATPAPPPTYNGTIRPPLTQTPQSYPHHQYPGRYPPYYPPAPPHQ